MQDIIYLDNAATAFPKPKTVHTTAHMFYADCGVNPGRTGCELAVNAERMIVGTRKALSKFFNPSLAAAGKERDYRRLVFSLNGTMSLNIIINGTVGAGDHVVTTMCEHNSVIRPVNHRVRDHGAESTFVAPDPEGYVDPDDIRKAIKGNTSLVIVNHASNVSGVVQDLEAIGSVCKDRGVPFAVDVAQTAGVLPIDMLQCNISFLAFTGHKGLMAPSGTGGVCVSEDAEVRSTIVGGTGVDSLSPFHLTGYPHRLEAGTQNLQGIAGLAAGLDWIEERGRENIREHEMRLLAMLQDGLAEIPGASFQGTTRLDRRVATLSMTIDNWDPQDVGLILDGEYGIQTRTGLHCAPLIHQHYGTGERGTVRFSIGPFNTTEDIETTVRAVAEIAKDRN